MLKAVETVKKNPWTSAMTSIPVILALIYFIVDVNDWIVTQGDLNSAKIEIINEMRDESAKIRTAYLHDLESRLEDVEVEMESLSEANKPVPKSMRRKAKRLQRRINEITNGSN